MPQLTVTAIPGLEAGTWVVDPTHSEISFTVRHLMSKVRGVFHDFEGQIVVADNPFESSAQATVQLASVDTGTAQRDDHLRSSEFFDVTSKPVMTFSSTGLRADDDGFIVTGDLTVNAVTRPIELAVEVLGVETDGYGRTVVGFEATGELNRKEYGIDWNMPLDGGRFLVGDTVNLALTVQATKQS